MIILSEKIKDEVVMFTKEQIISSKRYMHNKDIINVVLHNNQSYTLKEVDELIQKFMEKKVK